MPAHNTTTNNQLEKKKLIMVPAMWCVGEANKRSNQVWLCHTELVSLCYVLFCLLLFKPREWVSRMKLRISQCLNVFLVVNSFKYQHQIKSQRNFIFHFRLVSRSVINHHVTYSTYLIPISSNTAILSTIFLMIPTWDIYIDQPHFGPISSLVKG